jgi:hypothetical protein
VELFFKWIKQNLRIRHFYGTSENAVKTQIWTAVYLIAAVIKKELALDVSLYTFLQILSVHAFEKSQPSTTNFISIPVRFSRAGMMSMIECVSARSAAGVDARPPIPISSPPLSFRSKRTSAAGSTSRSTRSEYT